MTLRALISGFALAAAMASPVLAQDDAVQGDAHKVVVDSTRVESPAAAASAHCLRWRAHAELIGTNGPYVTYRCVRIDALAGGAR